MTKPKIVLFDIDYTLFDSKKFREEIYRAIAATLKLNKNEVMEVGEEIIRTKTGYFEPEVFAEKLTKILERKDYKDRIIKFFYDDRLMQKCIYNESTKVVEYLNRKVLIVIFSKGKDLFQRGKLAAIKHLLEDKHIHITANKYETLPKLMKRYKGKRLYFVDDALDVLRAAQNLNPAIFTIWVMRGRFAEKQQPIAGFEPSAKVLNLRDVIQLVEQN